MPNTPTTIYTPVENQDNSSVTGISASDSKAIYNFWCNAAGESSDLKDGLGYKYLNGRFYDLLLV